MLCTPFRITFNIRTNPKYPDLKSSDLNIPETEEKYLKIIDGALFNDSTITLRIASEIVFFCNKDGFTHFSHKKNRSLKLGDYTIEFTIYKK